MPPANTQFKGRFQTITCMGGVGVWSQTGRIARKSSDVTVSLSSLLPVLSSNCMGFMWLSNMRNLFYQEVYACGNRRASPISRKKPRSCTLCIGTCFSSHQEPDYEFALDPVKKNYMGAISLMQMPKCSVVCATRPRCPIVQLLFPVALFLSAYYHYLYRLQH